MGIENFFSDSLAGHYDLTAYAVSRKLAELFPGRAVVEGETSSFDLEEYARAGLCAVVREARVHHQSQTRWDGPGEPLKRVPVNEWLNVLWRGRLLDVLVMHFTEGGCWTRHFWIVADAREDAEGFFRAVCERCAEVRAEILVFDDGYWQKSERLFAAIRAATFDTLILPATLRREIENDFAHFFASRETYERYGVPWKRGVLLIGPPGNGKTHTVKALVNRTGRPCLYVKSFKSSCGTEHDNIRAVFARARQAAPCLLVFEDLDSLVDDENRSFFLNELDGFETNTGLVVVATTNHPERLDPAILDRPSRFDRKFYFELPAREERRRFIEAWDGRWQGEMRLSAAARGSLEELTEGFSFAYLKELFLSSMMEWIGTAEAGAMDEVALGRAEILRRQMARAAESDEKAAPAAARAEVTA
ncbi:MAG: ATP-binding protein [Acidobacteria bacterium]|nr:ATP-binding protein [Acidobacteriota bacterium]